MIPLHDKQRCFYFFPHPVRVPLCHKFFIMTKEINILHVDDSTTITSIIGEMLKGLASIGAIERAATCKTAKEIMQGKDIDVVILDIDLPDGNGMELLRWIKSNHPSVRVFIFSNHADVFHRGYAKAYGADHYFDKSTESDLLLNIFEPFNNKS